MNILIPHNWLLEHLETDATPTEIQKFLSLCGPSVERIYDREGEPVYDIEVTTNRVDCMSVRGIAREAAVILPQFGKKAKLKKLTLQSIKPAGKTLPLPTIVNDPQLCQRTLAVILDDVKRNPTPEWMAKRLRQIDGNVHDAVIDITNYVTHDLGHPCHAFDYDKIMELGGTIIVKIAEKGKKFVTLDGEEYTTVGGEVVFENNQGDIIDLPAIKGTANTSINESTNRVLFWIESITPSKVRFASMTHAIRTVAAQLNEKNIDPELALPVMEEGTELFQKLCGCTIVSKLYDDFPGKKTPATVVTPLKQIYQYLGIELPINRMAQILEDLDCQVELKGEEKKKNTGRPTKSAKAASVATSASTGPVFLVTPPSFRPDLRIPADIIEEIARIYGYHQLPSVLMPTAIPIDRPKDTNFYLENRIKRFLAAIGWQEVYTYSMVSDVIAVQSGYALTEHLQLQNPLTDDRVYLRRSLIPSLEEIITNNSQQKNLDVFEIANVYHPQSHDLPIEQLHLSMVSTRPYREVKGNLEVLLQQFFISPPQIVVSTNPMPPYVEVGVITVNHKDLEHELGTIHILANGHVAVVLGIKNLIAVAETHPTYQPLPKTNEIIEDLTFTLPARTAIGPILAELQKISPLIRSVELKDVYDQNYTLTLTYHNPEQNLTAEDVKPLRQKVVSEAAKRWQTQLVGKVE